MTDSEPASFFHLGYDIGSDASELRQVAFEDLRSWMRGDNHELYGAIVVTGLGAGALILEDELPPLVRHLCIDALVALERGESYSWHIFSYPGRAEVRGEGERVSILLDDRVLGTFAKRPLVRALWNVGQLFITMYLEVLAADPLMAGDGRWLTAGLDAARAAVGRLLGEK